MWCSGLRIQCCCSCGIGGSSSLDLILGLGNSIYSRCGQKKKKKGGIEVSKAKCKLWERGVGGAGQGALGRDSGLHCNEPKVIAFSALVGWR